MCMALIFNFLNIYYCCSWIALFCKYGTMGETSSCYGDSCLSCILYYLLETKIIVSSLFLQQILDQINLLMGRLCILPFIHVYMEHSMQEDKLSKKKLKLLKNSWCWWKMERMGIIIKGQDLGSHKEVHSRRY